MTEQTLREHIEFIDEIKEIIELINDRNFNCLANTNRLGDSSPEEYALRIEEIFKNKKITIPPEESLKESPLFHLNKDPQDIYSIDIVLWSENQQSDAIATFCVRRSPHEGYPPLYLYDIRIA